ncbi:GtrA family protein [Tardiphaga sp.]|uniref:GtrA family protein n=1 Tax=Tardiphaga sp. TaxID=1926292 RepID=UPI00352AE0FB
MSIVPRPRWRSFAKTIASDDRTAIQAARFLLTGLKSNFLYFIIYLILTALDVEPLVAVTLVFVLGLIYTFWFSKNLVFRNRQGSPKQFARYSLVYVLAWLLNLLLLDTATKKFGVDHRAAQFLIAMAITAPLFLAQRFFVFASRGDNPASDVNNVDTRGSS